MTQNADYADTPAPDPRDHLPSLLPTMHGYYLRNGYESCPTCGEWLLPQNGRSGT